MKPETFRARGGWAAFAIGCLLGLTAVPAILAAPLPTPVGLGATIVGTGSPVTIRIVPTAPEFTSEIYYFSETDPGSGLIGKNPDSTEVTTGPIPEAQEILIFIRVLDTGNMFQGGPADRNLDDCAHAIVRQKNPTTLEVSFEDIFELGDRDYNDVIVEIEGAKMRVPFSGLPLSPAAGSNLTLDQNGGLLIQPILVGDESGVSISLGEADGWQGTIGFDGRTPNAQLTYSVQSEAGDPDLIGRHTASAAGDMTDLELVFPRAVSRAPLQVSAFRAGEEVASFALEPTADQLVTFAVARYLETQGNKRITVSKDTVTNPVGTIVQERVRIETGLTSGEIQGAGNLSFDTLELTFTDQGFPRSGFSEVTLSAAGVPALTLETQSVSTFRRFHHALGGATLVPAGGVLTIDHGAAVDDRPGVAIDLGDEESFSLSWSRFIPLGLTLTGSSLELSAQNFGSLNVTQLTMADTDAEITADFSALGSPSQRILVYNGETLTAEVTGHTGAAARSLAWPIGAGIGQEDFGPLRQSGYALQFPEDTWLQILGGPWMVGDRLLVIAENPSASVGSVSQLSLRMKDLPFISLIDEAVFPLLPPRATPNLRISVEWGSSGVGSSAYGPRLTAYIAVKNTSGVDCYPPSGASFVIGAYYKKLGLMKATSAGLFPAVIRAGETKYFIAQSLDDPHQNAAYNGFVDFYVSSQAPGDLDLSAAIRPACEGELNLADNNAHSAKKIIANP